MAGMLSRKNASRSPEKVRVLPLWIGLIPKPFTLSSQKPLLISPKTFYVRYLSEVLWVLDRRHWSLFLLIYTKSINTTRQITSLKVQLQTKRWYHISVTHNTQKALNGGNTIKVYVDGVLASSERLRLATRPAVELKCQCTFKWHWLDGNAQDLC